MNASLIVECAPDRYQLHDLVRQHATALAEQHDAPEDRDLTVRRMIRWHLHRMAEADRTLSPLPRRFSPIFDTVTATGFADASAAQAWFDVERTTILACLQFAADRGWNELVYQLAETVWNALRPNYSAETLLDTQQLGVDAARRCRAADPAGGSGREHVVEAVCLIRVAFAESNLGRHDTAVSTATGALDHAVALGHDWVMSAALSTRGRAHLAADHPHAALVDLFPSLQIAERMGDPRSMALRHRRIGQTLCHPALADYERAIEHFQHAATHMRTIGDALGHSRVIIYLADALIHLGRLDSALFELEQVVDAVRAHGSPGYTADLCTALGNVHNRLGDTAAAHGCYSEAVQFYEVAGIGATRQRDSVALLRDALPPPSTITDQQLPEDDMLEAGVPPTFRTEDLIRSGLEWRMGNAGTA